MIKTLSSAATGLEAQQANIERISNDLANANTDGYKRGQTEFSELMYETIKQPGAPLGAASQTPVGIQRGLGVKVAGQYKNFDQGSLRTTSSPYDIAIEGTGFFQVTKPNGEIGFTRMGSFHLDSQGRLGMTNGSRLLPEFQVPPAAIGVTITPNGEVSATMQDQSRRALGQIQIANFQNPQGLISIGSGLYSASDASGPPLVSVPGENGTGPLLQSHLEGSNVNIANSMVDMITTQRIYELNTKVMSAADKMMEHTINLK